MGKTFKKHKRYFDDDYGENDDFSNHDRREQRKLKRALKTKNIDEIMTDDSNIDYEPDENWRW